MSKGAPRHLVNGAGLSLELNRDGGVRRIQFREDVVNLFMGNGMEPGPSNVWLRLHRGARVDAVPLLGPRSPLRASASRGRRAFQSRGEWQGLGIALRLVLAAQEATCCWQVRLENRSSQEQTVDLVYGQDIALASHGAVRLNEYYVSHYIDFTPLEHARCGAPWEAPRVCFHVVDEVEHEVAAGQPGLDPAGGAEPEQDHRGHHDLLRRRGLSWLAAQRHPEA